MDDAVNGDGVLLDVDTVSFALEDNESLGGGVGGSAVNVSRGGYVNEEGHGSIAPASITENQNNDQCDVYKNNTNAKEGLFFLCNEVVKLNMNSNIQYLSQSSNRFLL